VRGTGHPVSRPCLHLNRAEQREIGVGGESVSCGFPADHRHRCGIPCGCGVDGPERDACYGLGKRPTHARNTRPTGRWSNYRCKEAHSRVELTPR